MAEKRLSEAQILFRARLYEGAYHMAGMAVECAVKACIARQTRRFEFPDKTRAQESFDHNLADLVRVAGLQTALDQAVGDAIFAANWNTVREWRIESRYTTVRKSDAEAILLSITNSAKGVMPWLRIHW